MSTPAQPGAAHTITRLLDDARRGDGSAYDHVLRALYQELHGIAARHMRGERPGHTLQPTALVHEAFLRLVGGDASFDDRAHFLRTASRVMRRVLVDHARARDAAKRGSGLRVTLDEAIAARVGGAGDDERVVELLALDDALERLAAAEPRWAQVVELRVFGGLEVTEVARALGVSTPTVKRDWAFAKAWLARELTRGE